MLSRPPIAGVQLVARRPLKIFASDPLAGRTYGNRAKIDVVNEPLTAGPRGSRLEVIDYDGAQKRFYAPVDLDHPAILMQGGLEPSESDPKFHQQMVYAVAMKTLENFERALGRIVSLRRSRSGRVQPLRLYPHAFYGANAFYQPKLHGILFGYFKADEQNPGPNLPGQMVFTCLSHDIIAHEMTHAVVNQLRPHFLEPSNEDVLAFHEGFSDLVALFQHFSFQDVVKEQIQRTRSDIRTPTPLVEIARQFGYASGTGGALRSALDKPEAKLYQTVTEPHARGSILVAAVFDGFVTTYQRRIYDLIRIATGGTGTLPQGDLHPDLVNRIASEASKTAQRVLDMCIRAFEYLPPVDVTFGDFLRAMVTADFELFPDDDTNIRSAMIEAFRLRGIFPVGVTSLAEESLLWERAPTTLPKIGGDFKELLPTLFFEALHRFDWVSYDAATLIAEIAIADAGLVEDESPDLQEVQTFAAKYLHSYATSNAVTLGLDPNRKIRVQGFHPVFRIAPNGRLLVEVVVQYSQQVDGSHEELGGIPFRGGVTLIASADGEVRYLINKPMDYAAADPRFSAAAKQRRERQAEYMRMCDMRSAMGPYYTHNERQVRMARMMDFSALHGE